MAQPPSVLVVHGPLQLSQNMTYNSVQPATAASSEWLNVINNPKCQ